VFTGIIEEIGTVSAVRKAEKSLRITIEADKILREAVIGDSISTNGVCLTITKFTNGCFAADVMAETMRKSNLYDLSIGDRVNLESALKVGDRLSGHILSGHIDGMGRIVNFKKEDNAVWVTVAPQDELLRYIVLKGSVAIDGISLTVGYIDQSSFNVCIIPHTKEATTLIKKRTGDHVNIECDLFGKYIEKMFFLKEQIQKKRTVDMSFLDICGFL
jgi:riboflavin synthase